MAKKKIKLPKYGSGGKASIITHDPNDPRLRAYNDSLTLYDFTTDFKDLNSIVDKASNFKSAKDFENLLYSEADKKHPWTKKISDARDRLDKISPTGYVNPAFTREYNDVTKNGDKVHGFLSKWGEPVQPYQYQPNIKADDIKINSFEQDNNQAPFYGDKLPQGKIVPIKKDWFTRENQDQEQGDTQYFDKATGKPYQFKNGGEIMKKRNKGKLNVKNRKRAENGAEIQDQQMQQIMQMIAQALQQGQQPQQIMQLLVKQGVPPQVAQQAIQQVMQQSQQPQQGQEQQGELPMAEIGTQLDGAPYANPNMMINPGNNPYQQQNMSSNQSYPNMVIPPSQLANNPSNAQLSTLPTNQPIDNKVGPSTKDPFAVRRQNPRWYGDYNLTMAAASFNEGQYNDKLSHKSYMDGDPSAAKGYHIRGVGNNIAGAGYTISEIMDDTRNALLGISGAKAYRDAKKQEQESVNLAKRNAAEITGPYGLRGDDSQLGNGTNAAFTKYGGKLPKYSLGGMPTKGSDFNNGNPNVITERNEVVADAGTGTVIKEDGDLHSDPSGGNSRSYTPGSVIMSNSIGMKVGDFMDAFHDNPMIQEKIANKYKDENKIVSHADIANLFNTKEQVKKLEKVTKKMGKEEKYTNPQVETNVSQTTAKLNLGTLSDKKTNLENQITENNAIVSQVLFPIQEHMKNSGAYGSKIKEDSTKAKFGKKIILPKAGNGKKLDSGQEVRRLAYNIDANAPESAPDGYDNLLADLTGRGYDKFQADAIIQQARNPLAIPQTQLPNVVQPLPGEFIPDVNNIGKDKYKLTRDRELPVNDGEDSQMSQYGRGGRLPIARRGKRVNVPTNDGPNEYQDLIDADMEYLAKGGGDDYSGESLEEPKIGFQNIINSTRSNINGDPNDTQDYSIIDNSPGALPTVDNSVYSEVPNTYFPADSAPYNYHNVKSIFPQYLEKGDPNYYSQIASGLNKKELEPNVIQKGWQISGQKRNADGTFGDIAVDDIRRLSKSEGFENFMPSIAKKYGESDFATLLEKHLDKSGKPDNIYKSALSDYENAVNNRDAAEGRVPHFYDMDNRFGKDRKFGNWHASVPVQIRKSFGSGPGALTSESDKESPIVYRNVRGQAEATKEKDDAIGDIKGSLKKDGKPFMPYREGINPFQFVGEFGVLGDRYEAAPYIEDKGAADAFARGSRPRFTDIQPAINRYERAVKDQTRFRDGSPVNQAIQANAYANAYEGINQVQGQKYNNDAQIEGNFDRQQQDLLARAGTNKAAALNLSAERTAKGHSAYKDRVINALSSIGTKFVQNEADNRASALYQDMFHNYNLNPLTWGTDWVDNGTNLTVGSTISGVPDKSKLNHRDAEVLRRYGFLRAPDQYVDPDKEIKKMGGKVKLPKKSVRKLK